MVAIVCVAAPEVAEVGRDQETRRHDREASLTVLADQRTRRRDRSAEAEQPEDSQHEHPGVLVPPATEPERQEGCREDRPQQHPMKRLVGCEQRRQGRSRHENDGCREAVHGTDRRTQDADPVREGSDVD